MGNGHIASIAEVVLLAMDSITASELVTGVMSVIDRVIDGEIKVESCVRDYWRVNVRREELSRLSLIRV